MGIILANTQCQDLIMHPVQQCWTENEALRNTRCYLLCFLSCSVLCSTPSVECIPI